MWAAPATCMLRSWQRNGALLHALIGAVCLTEGEGSSSRSLGAAATVVGEAVAGGAAEAGPRASNVLMSFNNLQVREAVPVPLDLLKPAVEQLRGSDGRLSSLAERGLQQAASTVQQLAALPGALAPPALRAQQERLLAAARQWDPALLQLGSVFDEVGDGFTDFYPPPAETRSIIGAGYQCPATLLVQFTDDNTDETPEAEAILRTDWRRGGSASGSTAGNGASSGGSGSGGGGGSGASSPNGSGSKGLPSRSSGRGASAGGARRGVTRVVLPGTHLTPCGTSAPWRLEPGEPFGPAEALAAAGLAALQGDTLRLADRLVHWSLQRAAPTTMPASLAARVGVEMLGSLMTMCLAVGSVANALLPRTKGEGMGLLPIALSVGLGIGLPIGIFFRTSAFFNPGILMAVTVRGGVPAGDFFALLAAEILGYFAGAVVLWAFYLPHLNAAVQLPPADEIDRLLRDPAMLHDTALMNASYTLQAPHVTSQQSFWRFALQDLKEELGRAYAARKVADPFRTCPEELADACDTAGASLSRPGSHLQLQQLGTGAAAAPGQQQQQQQQQHDQQQAWGASAVSSGAAAQPGVHAAAAAEEGGYKQPGGIYKQPGGGLSPAGSVDEKGIPSQATARTFAERMRADAGPLRSRGHLAAALCKARQDVLLSVFVTRPAVWSPILNFVQEFVAMTIMATTALLLFESSRFQGQETGGLWPTQLGLLIGLLNTAMILSLGGATGPAINPARDLGPRLAFHILPIPGKGCTEWHYAWVHSWVAWQAARRRAAWWRPCPSCWGSPGLDEG
ncbi:glycerol transporter [Chlorella sorokiniana]|uniref:Glycerol transporter n=1 Tax=Chlorella sorokiniana TaxID=3076 RepID=A0A2P6U1Z9_CHLSO|nr:glycerol transporter [Chlorella sorokiniana]|eukprot:PRW60336.1 glycerol transporter [Chlorella sorokiniana]